MIKIKIKNKNKKLIIFNNDEIEYLISYFIKYI
jgi:hypothetical protein